MSGMVNYIYEKGKNNACQDDRWLLRVTKADR